MASHIIVSVRTSYAALAWAGDGYLTRARSLTSRAEALGATLTAWSAMTFAFAWDGESLEEAVSFACSLKDDAPSPEHAWASGIAEGNVELLAPSGQRADLAWGPALVVATSLARVAVAGEVLVDGDVRAMRAGELSTTGTRTSTDAGRRVRGWRLDTARPWRRAPGPKAGPPPLPSPPAPARVALPVPRAPTPMPLSDPNLVDVETTARIILPPIFDAPPHDLADADRTDENAIVIVSELEEVPESALELVDAAVPTEPPETWNDETEVRKGPADERAAPPVRPKAPPPAPPSAEGTNGNLAARVREMADASHAPSVGTLIALRRARQQADAGPAGARCQSALALSMALLLAGRHEDALLEALDATARAQESGDARAASACFAVLAKIFAAAGHTDGAARLRAVAG